MRGSRRSSIRIGVVAASAAAGALALPSGASAQNPPACDPSVYPTPFFVIDGSRFIGTTRYLKMRQNPKSANRPQDDSTPEQPFPLKVNRSRHASRTFTVHDYGRNQFPVFFLRPETAVATATYVEVHTEYTPLVTLFVRCTRTVTKKFKTPPRQRRPGGGGGGGDDPED